jgi:hypothetical protein
MALTRDVCSLQLSRTFPLCACVAPDSHEFCDAASSRISGNCITSDPLEDGRFAQILNGCRRFIAHAARLNTGV